MASLNKTLLIGQLGRDPEVRYTANGAAVCSLRLATTRNWKDRNSGERMEETEWHLVVLYDRLAEIAGEYLKKGRSCYIEGRLKTRKWQDKDGQDRYTTEIVADSLQLLGGAGGESGEAGARPSAARPASRPSARPAAAPGPASAARPAGAPKPSTSFDDMDDDIPF